MAVVTGSRLTPLREYNINSVLWVSGRAIDGAHFITVGEPPLWQGHFIIAGEPLSLWQRQQPSTLSCNKN